MMKMFIFGFALLATGSVFASTPVAVPVVHDKTGFFMHLDVDKVLYRTDISESCGVIPARLDYLDHAGQEHVLDYQVEGSGCTNEN